MAAIHPYLTFNGTTEAAFLFYKSVFGGEFAMLMRFKDTPMQNEEAAKEGEKIMHVALPIGKHHVLMGSDSFDCMGQNVIAGNNFMVAISADSKEEADRLYAGLSAGGNPHMPMEETFWGDYFGMLHDKFGIQWSISFQQTPMD